MALYPCLSFFEGTIISTGRGTPFPFQVIGYPAPSFGHFQFTPISAPGKAPHPKHQDQPCFGLDLREVPVPHQLDLQYLLRFYQLATAQGLSFFGPTFDSHAGNQLLQQQIQAGLSERVIRASWQADLAAYKTKRKKYLLYDSQ